MACIAPGARSAETTSTPQCRPTQLLLASPLRFLPAGLSQLTHALSRTHPKCRISQLDAKSGSTFYVLETATPPLITWDHPSSYDPLHESLHTDDARAARDEFHPKIEEARGEAGPPKYTAPPSSEQGSGGSRFKQLPSNLANAWLNSHKNRWSYHFNNVQNGLVGTVRSLIYLEPFLISECDLLL